MAGDIHINFRIAPLLFPYIPDPYEYLLTLEKFMRFNNQIFQFPGPIVNDKVFRMADLAIHGMNVIFCHVKNTLQMQIDTWIVILIKSLFNNLPIENNRSVGLTAFIVPRPPIIQSGVIVGKFNFLLTVDRFLGIDIGTLAYLLLCKVYKKRSWFSWFIYERKWRKENFSPG